MELLFHTISVEPARWTRERTSRPLVTLLPEVAAAGFHRIEVYEPHLTAATTVPDIREAFRSHGLTPEVLSSYLNLNPAKTPLPEMEAKLGELRARVEYYGFRGVRIFPGPGMNPSDPEAIGAFTGRLERVAAALPGTAILLETHDGSLADDPEVITEIVRELDHPSVGLLYQPTRFEPESALRQFAVQQPFIRHVHLQNRHPDGSFASLREGVVPWDRIIAQLDPRVAASLEFVPLGICPVEKFDLGATLEQARAEAEYIRQLPA